MPAAGAVKERHADAGAAIDEEWKGDRYNAAEDEKGGGVRHAALGALHAGEVLGAEQVIDAVNEIDDSGNGVALLQGRSPARQGSSGCVIAEYPLNRFGSTCFQLVNFHGRKHSSGTGEAQRLAAVPGKAPGQ